MVIIITMIMLNTVTIIVIMSSGMKLCWHD